MAEDLQLDKQKLEAALRRQKELDGQNLEADDRKRKYNSLADGGGVTEEEMEAYRMTKARENDPILRAMQSGGQEQGYDYV